jgi:hypothetical protein
VIRLAGNKRQTPEFDIDDMRTLEGVKELVIRSSGDIDREKQVAFPDKPAKKIKGLNVQISTLRRWRHS